MGQVFIGQAAVPTTDTTLDITASGMTGNPQAVELWMARATANDTATTHGAMCSGATDGTNQFVIAHGSVDSANPTNTHRRFSSSACLAMMDNTGSGTFDGEMEFDSWIEGGVRLDVLSANTFSSAWLVTAVFYQGFDNVDVGNFTIPTTAASPLSVSMGFQPNVVKTFSAMTDTITTGSSIAKSCYGFTVDSGGITEHCLSTIGEDNVSPSSKRNYLSATDSFRFWSDAGSQNSEGGISAFGSDGFDFTTTDGGAEGLEICYLAIDTGTQAVSLNTHTMPTSTGNDIRSGLSFMPSSVHYITHRKTNQNTQSTNNRASAIGLAAFTSTQTGSVATNDRDNSTAAESSSGTSNANIVTMDFNTTIEASGSLVSMNPDGYTINWASVDTAWLISELAFEDEGGGSVNKRSRGLLLEVG